MTNEGIDFTSHWNDMLRKSTKTLNYLKSLSSYLNPVARIYLAKTFVLSRLEYGSQTSALG